MTNLRILAIKLLLLLMCISCSTPNNSSLSNGNQIGGPLIAFVSDRDGNNEIYVMNLDGSNQTNLTNNNADDNTPRFSPDGSKIVFVSDRDGNRELYLLNLENRFLSRLTNNSGPDALPQFSPDGTKILYRYCFENSVMSG